MTMDIIGVVEERIHAEEVRVYICWGEYLEVRSNGGLTYHGGRSDCVWLRTGMGIGNILKVVEEVMRDYLSERKLWYNIEYDRSMILLVQGDADVWKLIKGNDEFSYMYVAEEDGHIRQKVQVSEAIRDRNLGGASSVGGKGGCAGVADDGIHNGGGMACVGIHGR